MGISKKILRFWVEIGQILPNRAVWVLQMLNNYWLLTDVFAFADHWYYSTDYQFGTLLGYAFK